jgi:hypothetical protein
VRRSTQVALFALDLHVLGTPPAFVLSQDQTLQDGLEVLTGNLPPASFETEESLASVGVCSDKTLIYCEPLQYFLGLLSSFQGANYNFGFFLSISAASLLRFGAAFFLSTLLAAGSATSFFRPRFFLIRDVFCGLHPVAGVARRGASNTLAFFRLQQPFSRVMLIF